MFSPTFARTCSRFSVLLAVTILLAGALPALGQSTCVPNQCGYSSCHTPAKGVASQLWGELEPTDTGQLPSNRDSTDFKQIVGSWVDNPYWMSVDPENGYIFAVGSQRFQIWDGRSTPGNPVLMGDVTLASMGLTWGFDAHAFIIFQDVDAPPGRDDLVAMVGENGVGLVVWKTGNKANPTIVYQDHGPGSPPQREATQVYATTIGSNAYAFVAASADGGGLHAYDLTKASQLTTRCTEGQPGAASLCPGVYLGKIGTRSIANFVDGAGNFVAVSSGSNPAGVEIWNVANPSSPQLVMNALSSDAIFGVSMWQQGSNYYLGVRTTTQGRIYNVSCITGGSCSPGAPLWTQTMPFTVNGFVTDSSSGGTPFLYFGMGDDCLAGNQYEWLLDVSNPSSPRDISPQGTVINNGEAVSYWGWYYRKNGVHGLNFVAPRLGKFAGDYFYRAAKAIFDIHRRTGGSPPVASFTWSPTEIYPNTPVTFTDTSTAAPNSWSWTFAPDGSPSSSANQNPTNVTFPATGTKTVTLVASNAAGVSDPRVQNLTVLAPQPNVSGGVSGSPNPALLCQPVTFMAQGVTGKPPLTFAWQVRDSGGQTVDSGGNINPFVWTTSSTLSAGTYTAEVTVSNSSGTTMASRAVQIQSLPPLPGGGTFTPTYDGAPNPPASGTVNFHVTATGATEWSWDFGEGSGYGPWSSDPVTGPNPTHTYTTASTYSVRVRVRNCVEPLVESNAVSVDVTNIEPLAAQFTATAGVFCTGGACIGDVGQAIAFVDQSTGPPDRWDYDWDGNGGFEDSNHNAPVTTHTYTSAGTYSPKLRVWRGTETSATFTHATLTISTGGGGGGGGTPSISISGPTSGTAGASLTFSGNALNCTPSSSGWTWTLSGGTASGSTTGSSITVSWSASGSKTITAKNTGCSTATGTKTVNITTSGGGGGGGGALGAVFTITPSSPTTGQTVNFDATSSTGSPTVYVWDFGDGGSAEGSTASHVYTAPGTYMVALEVSRINDSTCPPFNICTDVETKSVVVGSSGPKASFNVNVPCIGSLCSVTAGQRVSFNDTSTGTIASRLWDFGDTTTSTAAAPTHTWSTPGSYTVKLTVSNGDESDSTTRLFQVNPPPIAAEFNVNVACAEDSCTVLRGQQVTFTDASTGSFTSRVWDFDDGTTSTLAAPVHSWSQPGSYTVTLTISDGSQQDEATLDFQVNLPPLVAAFTIDLECAETCEVATGDEVAFTDASSGDVTSWSWDFGDGETSTEASPTHAWGEPGDYKVTLTVGDGFQTSETNLDITVVGPPPGANRVLLPWVVQGQGALNQVSTLYVHNPDTESRIFNLRFYKRPSQADAPPQVPVQLNPGATAFFADVLADVFEVDNVSGYLEIEPTEPDAPAPVVAGFHRTFQDDGTSFGQAVPGVSMLRLPKADSSDRLHLVGLNDNNDRFGFFGVTNPNDGPVSFLLHFFNRRGDHIGVGEDEPLTVARRGQRQFQINQLRNTFGIHDEVDYRVEIELLSENGTIYPYGTNLRQGTEDPSFVRTGEFDAPTVFLLGALATKGLNDTEWRTDALLVNIADEPLRTEIRFVNVGNNSEELPAVSVTLLPGESKRLENILVDRWGLDAESSLGVLRFDTTSDSGIFPIIHGESYDNANPARRFGQYIPALTSNDVAQAGQRQVLTGLQQDDSSRTTVWLYNPGEAGAEYDLVYRALNGTELGVLEGIRVRPGRMRQINPANHPLPDGVAEKGFTIQVIVRDGDLLSAAQVVSNDTNDPTFVVGVTR